MYGAFTVLTPNGGETIGANSSYNITWATSSGTIPNVKLEYSADEFVNDINAISASAPNTGSYAWVPAARETFKIRISGIPTAIPVMFRIITLPFPGLALPRRQAEKFCAQETPTILSGIIRVPPLGIGITADGLGG